MDVVSQLENLIVAGSENFFDEPEFRQDLHVTIRISNDFYGFLQKCGERPLPRDVAYVMDTIRSGMDQLFDLAYLFRRLKKGNHAASLDSEMHWEFSKLRRTFINDFNRLVADSDANASEKIASLLALAHLQLLFLAQHFPSAIFEEADNGSEPASSGHKT